MKEIQLKKEIQEYNALRVILTILVVVGHSIVITSITAYGGYDYSTGGLDKTFVLRIFLLLHNIIYSFHMPCFFALSGALFHKAIIAKRYESSKDLIKEKSIRLLLPYIVVSLIWIFPWKMISGYYVTSKNVLLDFFVGQMLFQGNSHLWFLPTLFLIFIVIYHLRNAKKRYDLVILLIAYILSYLCTINIVMFVLKYSVWFYLGYMFEQHRENINQKICLKLFFSSVFLFVFSYILGTVVNFTGFFAILNTVIDFIKALTGAISAYILSVYVAKKGLLEKKWFQVINKYSFGIYLYSDTLNYPILSTMFHLCGSFIFAGTIGYLLLFFTRVITSMIISIVVTYFLKHLKIKLIC